MAHSHTSTSPSSFAWLAALALALALAGGCGGDDGSATGAEGGSSGETSATTASNDTQSDGPTTTASTSVSTSADSGSTGMTEATSADTSGSDSGGPMGVACINDQYVNTPYPGADYSLFDVPIGSHCQGTNQQDITDIERVVFLGDSVSVGTPPTPAAQFYRSILANALATQFGLTPPEAQWEQVDVNNGTSSVQDSGSFSSCAVWGARNDDLAAQLETCFVTEDYAARTLVVFTMGGNDGAAIAKDYLDGAPLADVLAELDAMVLAHEQAVQWLVADPDKFPNGIFVVNANVYEFTDLTFEFLSCPTAALAGFNSNPDMPDVLLSSLRHINEEYMRIAQENGTDVVFMSEGFCGHGFRAGDTESACYRGPGNETWFDLTCIHPTPNGHAALADMFLNVISE